jgi:predicted MFS family arabinose efflux permease
MHIDMGQQRLRFPRSSPYWPALSHPLLQRILPGLTVSALGDGMALVAVTWLALQLATGPDRTTWVSAAIVAYTVPSIAGTLLLGRLLGGRPGTQLAGWDAILRATALMAIPVVHLLGALNIEVYISLLGLSSLLHGWGSAGRFTLIAELLPDHDRIPANAILATITELAAITGPPLAGLLIGWRGAVTVIAIDAATFAALAATYRLAQPHHTHQRPTSDAPASRNAGFGIIRRSRTLASLCALSFGFFLAFGPVYIALPVFVTDTLHGSATLLSLYYTAFGVGAVIGGLSTGYMRRWRPWPTLIAIMLGLGIAMLPIGVGAPTPVTLTCFALAGLIWAPYMPISMALFQRSTTTALLPQVLAANSAIAVLSVPLGTMIGAPLVAAIGAQTTLLTCSIAIITLGLATTSVATLIHVRHVSAGDAMPIVAGPVASE